MPLTVKLKGCSGAELISGIIKGLENGEIETWSVKYLYKGKKPHFTLTTSDGQVREAWMTPSGLEAKAAKFNFVQTDPAAEPNLELYAEYHRRFSELLHSHFRDRVASII